MGWSRHAEVFLELGFRAMPVLLPFLPASSFRIAWQTDRRAARVVLGTGADRGAAQAVNLLAADSRCRPGC
jgi:ATP-binding cassette subfamily B protein